MQRGAKSESDNLEFLKAIVGREVNEFLDRSEIEDVLEDVIVSMTNRKWQEFQAERNEGDEAVNLTLAESRVKPCPV